MTILYIYDGNWPRGATRVEKQVRSLVSAGHRVVLLCRNEDRLPREIVEDGLIVRRLPHMRNPTFNRVLNFPYFFNPVWLAEMVRCARRFDVQRILVSDLPLAQTALWTGRATGVPVLYDMAEVYPEFLRGLWEFGTMAWSDRLVRNPRLADWLERRILRRVDHTFVVSEESRTRAIEIGADGEKVTIVGNTPANVPADVPTAPVPAQLAPHLGRPIILFVGVLVADRGVPLAVRALRRVLVERPDALLVVVGDGPDLPRIREAIERYRLERSVLLAGWQQHDHLGGFYAASDIGLLPFHNGSHVRITLANKLFDYMAAGLPIVGSDLPPIRRIVEDAGCGELADPDDADALGTAILSVLADPARMERMGMNGRSAVLDRYSWRHDRERFVAAVERQRREHPGRGGGLGRRAA